MTYALLASRSRRARNPLLSVGHVPGPCPPLWRRRRDGIGFPPVIRPTRPPDDRRARHEARGEWPQPSLAALLDARVRATPDRVCIVEGRRDGERSFSFADLAARAARMAGALHRLGIGRGD